jgi:hypothetical protein
MEKAVREKELALRDDDNVFDVAFEQQGDGNDVLSATDIKVHIRTPFCALQLPRDCRWRQKFRLGPLLRLAVEAFCQLQGL